MTLDNMTGITKGSWTGDSLFCKSQLITCNRVKECNGVCPFEDALKHADRVYEQSLNEQNIDHDRDWIIGCIEHDGFIHTYRFDKANQIIYDALSADTSSDLISRADAIEAVASITMSIHLSDVICDKLLALPSADAVQGEWVDWLGNGNEWECSVCKCSVESHGSIAYKYCPMCGARMKGGDTE